QNQRPGAGNAAGSFNLGAFAPGGVMPLGMHSHDGRQNQRPGAGNAAGSFNLGAFAPEALAEYLRCFSNPATIHASCEDYRAAASIDLDHDRADLARKVGCPLLALWGVQGLPGRSTDVLALWRERAADVRGFALPCGHFLAEEAPQATEDALSAFFLEESGGER
ncbi:MAG: alpha/beta hydrolase, partial [Pseudomonadota bacterium]